MPKLFRTRSLHIVDNSIGRQMYNTIDQVNSHIEGNCEGSERSSDGCAEGRRDGETSDNEIETYEAPRIILPEDVGQQDLTSPTLISDAYQKYVESGVLVIENLFQKRTIEYLRNYFQIHYADYFKPQESEDALQVGNKRKMVTVDLEGPFNNPEIYANLMLMPLLEKLLDSKFILGSYGVVCSLPGAKDQHVHIDHYSLFQEQKHHVALPSYSITLLIPLIDLTPETGSTRVWKGSHRFPLDKEIPKSLSSVPYMETGSCFLMDYQLTHSGTPNISNLVRPNLYIIYYRPWFKEAVNYKVQRPIRMTQAEYDKVPQQYRFLFKRVKETLELEQQAVVEYIKQRGTGAAMPAYLEEALADQEGADGVAEANERDRVNKLDVDQALLEEPLEEHSDIVREKSGINRRQPSAVPFHRRPSSIQSAIIAEAVQAALPMYGLGECQVEPISHSDNAVFKVSTYLLERPLSKLKGYEPNQFIFRVYRSNYLTLPEIASEIRWLKLLHEQGVRVPLPVETLSGEPLIQIAGEALDQPRVCVLLRSLSGEVCPSPPSDPSDIQAMGRLFGQLHAFDPARLPARFNRPVWDHNGLFAERAGFSGSDVDVWALMPKEHYAHYRYIADEMTEVFDNLDRGPEQFGLLHADAWYGNVMNDQGHYGLLDFTDCGFGFWGLDVARFLMSYGHRNHSIAVTKFLDHFLRGYSEVKTFPSNQVALIPKFIVANHLSLALWHLNRSIDHSSYRKNLNTKLGEKVEKMLQLVNS